MCVCMWICVPVRGYMRVCVRVCVRVRVGMHGASRGGGTAPRERATSAVHVRTQTQGSSAHAAKRDAVAHLKESKHGGVHGGMLQVQRSQGSQHGAARKPRGKHLRLKHAGHTTNLQQS